jgi:hypothetical protein
MRVLFVVAEAEPQIAHRSAHLLEALGTLGHHLTLLTTDGPGSTELVRDGAAACEHVVQVPWSRRLRHLAGLRALPGNLPWRAGQYFASPLITAVQREMRRQHYDLVHLAGMTSAALGYAAGRLPVVLDVFHCLSFERERAMRHTLPPWQRAGAALDFLRLRRFEMDYPLAFEQIVVADPVAAWALQNLSGQLQRQIEDGVHASDQERRLILKQMAALTRIHVLAGGHTSAEWAAAATLLVRIYRRAIGDHLPPEPVSLA